MNSIYDQMNKIDDKESLNEKYNTEQPPLFTLHESRKNDSKYYVREFIKELGWPQECVDSYAIVDGVGEVDVFKGRGPYYNIRLHDVRCYSDKAAEIANQAKEFLKKHEIKFPYTTNWAGRGDVALILIPAYPNKFVIE